MAVRVRVAAIRLSTAAELQDTLIHRLGQDWAQVQLCEHNGWTSFRVSVWGSSHRELAEVLSDLQRPALLVTSEDGSRWFMSLFQPGHEPETLLHEFGNHSGPLNENHWTPDDDDAAPLDVTDDFLDGDPPEFPTTPFGNFAANMRDDYGCPLPDDLIARTYGMSFDEAIRYFQKWHQDRIVGFLQSQQVVCDIEQVRQTLNWQDLTEIELDSDLGNLPRLFSTIGLGGEWDQWLQDLNQEMESRSAHAQATDQTVPAEPRSVDTESVDTESVDTESVALGLDTPGQDIENGYEDGKFDEAEDEGFFDDEEQSVFAIMTTMLDGLHPIPVEGGDVKLPVKQFRLVEFFVHAACGGHEVAATLSYEFPESERKLAQELTKALGGDTDIEATALPLGFKLGFESHEYIERSYVKEVFGKKLAKTVAKPPDSTIFEFAFAALDEPGTQQIYRGTVKDSIWHIETTYPKLKIAAFGEALELAATAHKLTQRVRDKEEAEAILASLESPEQYHFDAEQLAIVHTPNKSVSGGVQFIVAEEELVVAEALFRLRYKALWDMTPAERFDREFQQLLGGADKAEESLTADEQQKLDEYKSKLSLARRVAVREARERKAKRIDKPIFEGAASRYWKSDVECFGDQNASDIAKFNNAMELLGYVIVDDLTCKRFRDFAMRCFAHPRNLNVATLTASRDGVHARDFVTRFSDGSILTTSASAMVESRPQARLFYKAFPDLATSELFEQHNKLVKRFSDRQRVDVVPIESTLLGIAQAFDFTLQKIDDDDLQDLEDTRNIWRY